MALSFPNCHYKYACTDKRNKLTQAFDSSAVCHARSRPCPSLPRRKRTGHRALCRHAGREVWVRRQQGWRGHWKLSDDHRQQIGDGGGGDEDGMNRQWRLSTGPPLTPQGTLEKDKRSNSHRKWFNVCLNLFLRGDIDPGNLRAGADVFSRNPPENESSVL